LCTNRNVQFSSYPKKSPKITLKKNEFFLIPKTAVKLGNRQKRHKNAPVFPVLTKLCKGKYWNGGKIFFQEKQKCACFPGFKNENSRSAFLRKNKVT